VGIFSIDPIVPLHRYSIFSISPIIINETQSFVDGHPSSSTLSNNISPHVVVLSKRTKQLHQDIVRIKEDLYFFE
jgi:hypothetical protein